MHRNIFIKNKNVDFSACVDAQTDLSRFRSHMPDGTFSRQQLFVNNIQSLFYKTVKTIKNTNDKK